MTVDRVRAVDPLHPQRAHLHLLEAKRQRAVGEAALHRLTRHVQGGRAGRAVVVDVHDRDPGEAEAVDGALPRRRLAVAVTDVRLLDRVVGGACVLQRLGAGLLRPIGIVTLLRAGLVELRHADADDVGPLWCHVLLSAQLDRCIGSCRRLPLGNSGREDGAPVLRRTAANALMRFGTRRSDVPHCAAPRAYDREHALGREAP